MYMYIRVHERHVQYIMYMYMYMHSTGIVQQNLAIS